MSAPGWYPNPDGSPTRRYWNGQTWTDHTAAIPVRKHRALTIAGSVVGAIALLVVFGVVTNGLGTASTPTATTTKTTTAQPLTNSNDTTHPPAADVKITGCAVSEGFATVTGVIDNRSADTSDYELQVGLYAHGARIGSAYDMETDVAHGQPTNFQAIGSVTGNLAGLTCRMVSVDRSQSTS